MKKIRMAMSLLLIVLALFAITACNGKEEKGAKTVNDLLERSVEVNPGEYKRAVCIGAGALRLYTYVCGAENLAGVEDIDNSSLTQRPKMFDSVARPYFVAFEDAFKSLPSCGVGGPQSQIAETEKIANCNPDIIISEYEDVDKANKLQADLNVPVIVVSYGPNGVFDNRAQSSIKLLGEIFGKAEKANSLVDFINSQKAEISRRVADIDVASQKKVYICGLGNWGTTNHLMTCQNYEPFNIAKVNNVVTDLAKNGIQAIEAEKFEALAPNMDIMILDIAAIKNIKPLYQENPHLFDNCKAWQDGEVYLELAYNAYYTNLEIALFNTWFIAKSIYPEQFSDIDMNAKLNEITNAFLGQELATKIISYALTYGKVNKETIFN